jgi:hypothetical protein
LDDPYEIVLLFNGGSCDQTSTSQSNYFCQDFNGGPPTLDGVQAYAVVTTADAQVSVSSAVTVGQTFTLGTGDQTLLPGRLNVTIYDSEAKVTQLQNFIFDTSCTQGKFVLADQFGSMQFIEASNAEQGVVSLSAPMVYELEANIEFTIRAPEQVRLQTFTVLSSLDGSTFHNLTNQVYGFLVDSQTPRIVSIPFTLDLNARQRYTFVAEAISEGDPPSCAGSESFEFFAGIPS